MSISTKEMPSCFLAVVGAHQAEAPVGLVGVGGPDLLAVDQPVVALVLALGLQAGEVGAGAGLGIALAPADLAVHDLRQDALLSAPRWRIRAAPAPASRCRTTSAAGAPDAAESPARSTRASAFDRPPPPYSLGQVGAVQPLSAMRSSQSFCSGFLNLARLPPQIELVVAFRHRDIGTAAHRGRAIGLQPGAGFVPERLEIAHCPHQSGHLGGPVPINCSGV